MRCGPKLQTAQHRFASAPFAAISERRQFASFADLEWWQVYRDETLQSLICEAFTNNYDLRIAMTRVEQARAVAAQARSQFFPSVNYNGSVSQGKNYLFGGVFPNNGSTGSSAVATLNAFWELDLWGRIRRLNESARAQMLASEEARSAVRLSLLSDVASGYFQLVELDQELEIASRTTNSFAGSLQNLQRAHGGRHGLRLGNAARGSRPGRCRRPRPRPFWSRFPSPKTNCAFCWAAIPARSNVRQPGPGRHDAS